MGNAERKQTDDVVVFALLPRGVGVYRKATVLCLLDETVKNPKVIIQWEFLFWEGGQVADHNARALGQLLGGEPLGIFAVALDEGIVVGESRFVA